MTATALTPLEVRIIEQLDRAGIDDPRACARVALDEVRRAFRDDPMLAVELGFTAGGNIYRGDGKGKGRFIRCFFMDPRT